MVHCVIIWKFRFGQFDFVVENVKNLWSKQHGQHIEMTKNWMLLENFEDFWNRLSI